MTRLKTIPSHGQQSVYVPRPAQVLEVKTLTDLEKHFSLAFVDQQPLGQQPGQFVQVSIPPPPPGIGECPISICSAPTRPAAFELCVRRIGEVTTHIHELEAGDIVGIRGPLGHGFDVREFYGKDVLIVAGGLGMAPARSLIQYILDERARFGNFHLLYGGRTPNELLFRDDLLRCAGATTSTSRRPWTNPIRSGAAEAEWSPPCLRTCRGWILNGPWWQSLARQSCSSSSCWKSWLGGYRRKTCIARWNAE